jgi:hypothetical protein
MEIGVCTHLGQGRTSIQSVNKGITTLGLSSIRDEIYWDHVERTPHEFSLNKTPTQLQEAFATKFTGENKSMLVLGYGNPIYENFGRPTKETTQIEFAKYAEFVAKKSNTANINYLEIWNEWNLSTGIKDKSNGTADDYVRLLKRTIPAIRSTNFKGKILIGGIGGDWPDWAFTKKAISQNTLQLADGYSVHLYNFSRNEVPFEMVNRVVRLQEILSEKNAGTPYPIYISEIGWPTSTSHHGVSEITAGAYISTLLFELSKFAWLKGIWIYELFDSGNDPGNDENRFGIFKSTGEEKAGMPIVKAAISLINTSHYISSGYGTNGARWLQFENNNLEKTIFVVYAPAKNQATSHIKFTTSGRVQIQTLGSNESSIVYAENPNNTEIAVGRVPQLLVINKTSINGNNTFK